jgi:hypothetical protein
MNNYHVGIVEGVVSGVMPRSSRCASSIIIKLKVAQLKILQQCSLIKRELEQRNRPRMFRNETNHVDEQLVKCANRHT